MTASLRKPSVAVLLLVAAAATSAAMLLFLQSHLTFFVDEWDLLLHRRGFSADAILRPHNEHIVVAPALIYKALQATLGMDSPAPYQALAIATFVASAVLLFVWLRPRVGEWLALFAATAILFLGAAWEDLLSPFQIGFFGSMAAGLGVLLALERETRRADALACVLLVVSISFSSLGLPFAVGAAAAVVTGPEARRRAWVVAIPAALYGLWWLGWGHTADPTISFENVVTAPSYVLAGIATSISALLGLAPPDLVPAVEPLDWGRPLLILAIGIVAWAVTRRDAVSRWLWIVGAITLAFWLLAAINAAPFRPPTAPRYQYIGAIFAILVAAELLSGVRLSRAALACLVVAGVATIGSNLVNLQHGYTVFRSLSENERAGLASLEFARDTVSPSFLLTPENADAPYFDYVDAASYLSAVDAFGSPAYTEAELSVASEPARIAADKASAAALRLRLTRAPAGAGSCRELEPDAADAEIARFELGPGPVVVDAGSRARVTVTAQRFSGSFPVELGRLDPGQSARLAIPADRATADWALELAGQGGARVCATS